MTGNPRRWVPAAVVVLAVAALAVAARRPGGLDAGLADGLWKNARQAAAPLAVLVLAVIAANFAKHRDTGYGLLHRAGTATALVLAAAAVLTPIGLVLLGRKPDPTPNHQLAPDPSSGSSSFPSPPGIRGVRGAGRGRPGKPLPEWIVQTVLILIAAAALALVVYVLIRLLSRLRVSRQGIQVLDFEPLEPEFDQLAEAVAAGTEALEYAGDAREAVIACYSAMEQAVSVGGGGRRATDTPEDFLRRVTGARLAPEEPARRLTELFREARFSRHPIAEDQREAAREALRAISDHLQVRAQELADATAKAQARSRAAAPTAGRAS